MGKSRKKKIKTSSKMFFLIIILVIITFFGGALYKRYSLTRERVNLFEYTGAKDDNVAIYINDILQVNKENGEKYQGICINNAAYLSMSWVKKYLNNGFYYAKDLRRILYTTVDEINSFGENDIHQVGNSKYVVFRDEPYLLINFVADFTKIRFDTHLMHENKRIYIYNDWERERLAYLKSSEAARIRGGNKSAIVADCKKGEEVKILEQMVKWCKVKTASGFIGYVRNTKLENETYREPSSNFVELKKEWYGINDKVVLGFHQVFSNYAANRLTDLLKNTKGMNVIAPTWYTIKNDNGDIRSLANAEYVKSCQKKGLKVWATVNNFDMGARDDKKIFSSSFIRRKMIDKIIREIEVCSLDGINLDIEGLNAESAEHFIEFVKELSIELTKRKVTFSVDTYIPFKMNRHYNIAELGKYCDYVIIMCYDEHYKGSDAGSVSSISFVRQGIELSLEKVDKEKLVIAVPFYTRIWTTDENGNVDSAAYGSNDAEAECKRKGIKTFDFDEETGQNYGFVETSSGSKIECWMEDSTSIGIKLYEIVKEDLAGVAAWKLTQEREDFFKILNINGI